MKSENNILRLWYSDKNKLNFKEHKNSPILISPLGSRMGGKILNISDSLYRLSQRIWILMVMAYVYLKFLKLIKKNKRRQIG